MLRRTPVQKKHYSLLDDEDEDKFVVANRRSFSGATRCVCLFTIVTVIAMVPVLLHEPTRAFVQQQTGHVHRIALTGAAAARAAVFSTPALAGVAKTREDATDDSRREPLQAEDFQVSSKDRALAWGAGEVIPITYGPTPWPTPRPTKQQAAARAALAAAKTAAAQATPLRSHAPKAQPGRHQPVPISQLNELHAKPALLQSGKIDMHCTHVCVKSIAHPKISAHFERIKDGSELSGYPAAYKQVAKDVKRPLYLSYYERGIVGRWIINADRAMPRKREPPGTLAFIDTWANKPCDIAKISPHASWIVKGQIDNSVTLKCDGWRHALPERPEKLQPHGGRVFLNNGYEMPLLTIGAVDGNSINSVKRGLDLGYASIDISTSEAFVTEVAIGGLLRRGNVDRQEIFVTAKLSPTSHGFGSALSAIAKIKRHLQVGYLDLLIMEHPACHMWNRGKLMRVRASECEGTWKDTWRAMEKAYARGMIKALGVSNLSLGELQQLLQFTTADVSVVQGRFDVQHPRAELRALCHRNLIWYQAIQLFGEAERLLQNAVVRRVARRYGGNEAQLLVQWARHKGVGIVLPATLSESLLLEAQEKRQSIMLSPIDVAELDEVAAVAMRSIV
eukprot:g2865.t1